MSRQYQEFYPSDCGNCWRMGEGPRPFYCNKHGCSEPAVEWEAGPCRFYRIYVNGAPAHRTCARFHAHERPTMPPTPHEAPKGPAEDPEGGVP